MITNAMLSTFLFGEAEASSLLAPAVEVERRLQGTSKSHFDAGSLYTADSCDAADTEVFKLCERADSGVEVEYFLTERAFTNPDIKVNGQWIRGPVQDWCPPGQEKILTKEECQDALTWMQAPGQAGPQGMPNGDKLRDNGFPESAWGHPLDLVVYPVSMGGVLRVLDADWNYPRGCFYTAGQEVLFNPFNINTPADHVTSRAATLCRTASN